MCGNTLDLIHAILQISKSYVENWYVIMGSLDDVEYKALIQSSYQNVDQADYWYPHLATYACITRKSEAGIFLLYSLGMFQGLQQLNFQH